MSRDNTSRRIGLARAISKLGYCSRSRAAELIRAGSVRLNGSIRRDPEAPVQLHHDRVLLEGREIANATSTYLMMNKPRGLVTTASDEKGRETVYSLLENSHFELPWVAPVGRLDMASEGLLLLTNDSEWGARVAAPETHLDKTYHVQVSSTAGKRIAKLLTQGIKVDGDFLRARSGRLLRTGGKNCWLEIVLDEGKNRQIRRMLAALEVEVLRLIRIAIGPLALGNLPKGAFRSLISEEKRALDHAMSRVQKLHE